MTNDNVLRVFGRSPGGSFTEVARKASLRALKTLIQGIAAAFPAAGAGAAILSIGYWETVGYSLLAAVITAFVSFLNNIATFLPQDPGQQ